MIRVVDEGTTFELEGADRAHLADVLGGDLSWNARGVFVWNVVGHVPLPSGTTLVIRSKKARAACLLAWAAYVDPCLRDLRELRLLEGVADDGDVGPALARMFCDELMRAAAANGLLKTYRRVRVRSTVVRGAIDFSQLARGGGDLSRVPCIAWERLPRTPLNRMFSATLSVIARDPHMREVSGRALLQLLALFAEVDADVEPAIRDGRRPLARSELPFAPSASLARMILRGSGLATGDERRGLGFLVRLDQLFERAVGKAFLDAGVGAVVKAPVPYARLEREEERASGTGALEMDCFIPGRGGGLVVDAKYKRAVSAENLQQMVTYCHVTGASHATLVFPKGEVQDLRSYGFTRPDGTRVVVQVEELDCSGRSVSSWREHGATLARDVLSRGKRFAGRIAS